MTPAVPYSEEAEVSVLSAMLQDRDAALRAVEHVEEAAFYKEANRRIFRAIAQLTADGRKVDPVVLADALKDRGELEAIGGMAYVARLVDAVPTAVNIESYIGIIREKLHRRRVIEEAEDLIRDAASVDAATLTDRTARMAELARMNGGPDGGRLPGPMGVSDLLRVEEPDEEWMVEGLVPVDGNLMIAGYPKTFKTMALLELGVALASRTPFLGRFHVPAKRRVGIVLMEDAAHRARRRLVRLCEGRGIELSDLDGWLYLWPRPPLRLDDRTVVELGDQAAQYDLDLLAVDSWAYVAGGDSNSADEVTPQLLALSRCRERRPGLTVELTHHARKDAGLGGQRLTDMIRNSSAFGAWYDAGLVLDRKDEQSPVSVRAELRDHEPPDPFAFTVEDQHPAGEDNRHRSGGWLRLRVSDHRPEVLERLEAARQLVPAVREFLGQHPDGVSRTKLRGGITGTNADIEAAFDLLEEAGEAEHIPPPGPGLPAVYRPLDPTLPNPADTLPRQGGGSDPADPAAPPEGGRVGQGSAAGKQTDDARQGSVSDREEFQTQLEQDAGA